MDSYYARQSTNLSLFDVAKIAPFDYRSLFDITYGNCEVLGKVSSQCQTFWIEKVWNGIQRPARQLLLSRIKVTETMLTNWLGYSPGSEYVEDELHRLNCLNDTIRLNKDKTIVTGTQNFRKVSDGIIQTRQILNNETIVYSFQNISLTQAEICNLFLFESGDFNLGNRLRPFEVDYDGVTLNVSLPIWICIKLNLYYEQLKENDNIKSFEICASNNYVEFLDIYVREFLQPSGKLYYTKKNNCNTTTLCNQEELDICLLPINPELGKFKIQVIEFVDGIWQDKDLSCLGLLYNESFNIKVNYLHGCVSSYNSVCIPDRLCNEFVLPVIAIALGQNPNACDCDCFNNAISQFTTNLMRSDKEGLYFINSATAGNPYTFGHTSGALFAYELLKYLSNRRREFIIL